MPKTKESMVVQSEMVKAYSAGAAEPTSVYLTTDDGKPLDKSGLHAYASKLAAVDGVDNVKLDRSSTRTGATADFTVTLKYGSATRPGDQRGRRRPDRRARRRTGRHQGAGRRPVVDLQGHQRRR